jgi:UDP-N-acetylmuramate--alanine ligase
VRKPGLVYIDDYAHHPTEIDAVHQAVSELYPDEKVLAVFQPHLYSRTRDFIDGFAKSLSAFDMVALLDIYPARELPIEGVTSQWLLDKIENENKTLIKKSDLVPFMKMTDAKVIVTIGAGDIGEMVTEIKNVLDEKN